MHEDDVGKQIVDSALKVHRALGPGLFESVYEAALSHELGARGLGVQRQVPIPINYDGVKLDEGFRADLMVAGKVLVELKSIERLADIHRKQVLTYLRLGDLRLGYLINFNHGLLKDGIERIANRLTEKPLGDLGVLGEKHSLSTGS